MAEPVPTGSVLGPKPTEGPQTEGHGRSTSAISFAQIQFGTIIIVLGASGLVPAPDIVCVLLASIYLYAMSRFVFPPVTERSPPSIYAGSKVLKVYVICAGFVGLYLPLLYIFLGVSMGDRKAVQAAAPHTFLLACQVLSEQMTYNSHYVSLPARALVPILYNSGRLVSIWSWVRTDFFKGVDDVSVPPEQAHVVGNWVLFSRTLSILNMLLWSYNLFCFLIPMYLPRCFRSYFEAEKVWAAKDSNKSK